MLCARMQTVEITRIDTPIGELRRGLDGRQGPRVHRASAREWLVACAAGSYHHFPDTQCVERIDAEPHGRRAAARIPGRRSGRISTCRSTCAERSSSGVSGTRSRKSRSANGAATATSRTRSVARRPCARWAHANGSNPVSLVVPCHRVINSDGKLGGYGGGLTLKARSAGDGEPPRRRSPALTRESTDDLGACMAASKGV